MIRSHPGFIKQTPATKKAAGLFGKASTISRLLREELKDTLPDHKDISMRLRLNAAILEYLRAKTSDRLSDAPSQLMSFEFNEKYRLASRLKKYPKVDQTEKGKLKVHFPTWNLREDIIAPVGAVKVYIKIILAGCCLDSLKPLKRQEREIVVDYVDQIIQPRTIEWEVDEINSLMVTVVSLRYEVDGKMNEDLRWRVVGVCAVLDV